MIDLLAALGRLDALLAAAVMRAEAAYGSQARNDFFRGLHIELAEVERLLDRPAGEPLFATGGPLFTTASWLGPLGADFALTPFDADAVLVAIAPELDLRYERLYAYLQDDVTRKRPTVDLVLNLLCSSAGEKLQRRDHFAATAPLLTQRVVRLLEPVDQREAPLLARVVKVDDQIIAAVLGSDRIDARLVDFCDVVTPKANRADLIMSPEARNLIERTASELMTSRRTLRIYLRGRDRRESDVVDALATLSGRSLLVADLDRASRGPSFADAIATVVREARLHDAVVVLEGVDTFVDGAESRELGALARTIRAQRDPMILTGTTPWSRVDHHGSGELASVVEIDIGLPTVGLRRQAWARGLDLDELEPGLDALDTLAANFRLSGGQIAAAAALARNRAALYEGGRGASLESHAFAAARAQGNTELSRLAVKVEPRHDWRDLVLPDGILTQLREISAWVTERDRVMNTWGFASRLSQGTGVAALFAGPSGTGKTMAAEVIAGELGLDLYAIDLSRIVSKWLGETEKNLECVFRAAQDGNAIICFNEADALFGKRSEVTDAHDRYANIEISYLLQKIEAFDGLAILTTNLLESIDDAFMRRLAFIVHFPFPEAVDRRRIWQGVWPAETPLANDVEFDRLAVQFQLSGGNIKNAALGAAYLAATESSTIRAQHVHRAIQREFAKMGQSVFIEKPDAMEVGGSQL